MPAPRPICAGISYASSVSVSLAWPRAAVKHPLAGSGFVVARRANTVRITACTWVSSKWAGRAPAGMVLLRAFIGGAHDPEAVEIRMTVRSSDMSSAICRRCWGSRARRC